MASEIADRVRSSISVSQFAESIGLHPDRSGFCRCPFHTGDRTASLKIYKDNRRGWTCFGCHKGGDVINMAMLWYGKDFTDTLHQLDDDFSLGLYGYQSMQQRIAARKRQQELIAQQKAAEEERRQADEAFDQSLQDWYNAEWIIHECDPRSMDEEFDPMFVEAVKMYSQACYEL